jgi:predicted permease
MFESVAAWDIDDLYVDWGGRLEPGQVLLASGNFHETLGVRAALGRTFDAADDDGAGGRYGPVAVISHACWQRRFGGAPSALGATVRVERVPFTIVGVMPRDFFGAAPGLAPEVTIPVTTMVQLRPDRPNILKGRSASWLHLIARLRPEVSLAQANGLLETVWPAVLEATFPPGIERREHYLSRTTRLEPGRTGFSRVRRQFAEPLWMLFSLVALLLLVACASAANLLLARTIARKRELATRLAIGAARGRIVRQLLTEAAIWIAGGAAAGLVMTTWASRAVVEMLATRVEPVVLDLEPDWRMFAFAVGLVVMAVGLVALLPALRASRIEPAPTLKQTGQISGARPGRWTAGTLLVAAQVGLTVLLLAGAALFVRSLIRVLGEEAGFERDNVVVASTDPIAAGYGDGRVGAFYDELVGRLGRIPGVESVALSLYPPISDEDGAWTENIAVDGIAVTPPPTDEVYFNVVSGGYFTTLGMRMLQGRDLDASDSSSSERVVVVNGSLAKRFFPGGAALGRRISIGRDPSRQNLRIVGIVEDAKYQTLQEPSRSIAYVPETQARERLAGENLFAIVRAPAALRTTGDTIRREIVAMEPGIPVHVERVTDRIRDSLVRERAVAVLAAVLGAAALLLACAALYGLMAYAVASRTSEIGIRLAFGAARGSVLWMVLRDAIVIAAVGVAAGLAASLLLGRFTRTLLYQISPTDPVSLGTAAAAMLIVAACAGFLPARRAADLDPVSALRE